MTPNEKVLNKKVKKVVLDTVQNYPQYLNSLCVLLHTKKLIVGISSTFEIKAFFANERRVGFIELDKEALLILLSSLSVISDKLLGLAKHKQELTKRYMLKVFNKNNITKVSIKDTITETTLFFSTEEFHKLCEFRNLLFHQLLKLTMNLPAVVNLYSKYIEKCLEKSILDFSTLEVAEIGATENIANLDFIRIIYEFYPILGANKINKDIEMYLITSDLK